MVKKEVLFYPKRPWDEMGKIFGYTDDHFLCASVSSACPVWPEDRTGVRNKEGASRPYKILPNFSKRFEIEGPWVGF